MNDREQEPHQRIMFKRAHRPWRLAAGVAVAVVAAVAPTLGVQAAGSWTAQASMPGGGCPGGNAVARGGDGRMYSFCGSASAAYNPATNTWSSFAPDPVSRDAFAVAEGKNGAIFVVGGCCNSGGNVLSVAEFYSPHTNSWHKVAAMPTPRDSLALTFDSGKFYALGGSDAQGNVTSEVDAYNPSTNTWSVVEGLPETGQCNLGAVTGSDGRIYAIGGMTFNCNSEPGWMGLNNVDAYSPASNTWTSVAKLPSDHHYSGRSSFGVTVGSDGHIYVIGGTEGSDCCGPGNRETATALSYTISTNKWSSITPLPTTGPLYYQPSAATSAGAGGLVYYFGGSSSAAAVYKFTP